MSVHDACAQAAGQVLVVGLEGTQLSAMESAWLRLMRPGGSHSLSPQHRDRRADPCLARAQPCRRLDRSALRCIDVEGGTVDRLRDLIAPMPSPFAVAATNKPALFEKHGSLIGQEAAPAGVERRLRPGARSANRCLRGRDDHPGRLRRSGPGHALRQAFLKGLAQAGRARLRQSISPAWAAARWTRTMPPRHRPNLRISCGKRTCCPTGSWPGNCPW